MKKLQGIELTLLSIDRQGLFGDAFVQVCENCGQTIINTATVQDKTGKQYVIGLDCKKNLIDKPVIDKMMAGDFMEQYKAKEYKAQIGHIQKFLKLVDDNTNTIECDGNGISIEDNKPNKIFSHTTGNTIYYENVFYLYKIGLKQVIHKLYKENRIKGVVPI